MKWGSSLHGVHLHEFPCLRGEPFVFGVVVHVVDACAHVVGGVEKSLEGSFAPDAVSGWEVRDDAKRLRGGLGEGAPHDVVAVLMTLDHQMRVVLEYGA